MKLASLGGLGVEGKATTRFLKKKYPKAKIVVLDRKLDKNYMARLNEFDVVYRTPGIPYNTKEIQKAIRKGVKVTSATEVFLEGARGTVIGVTGTKGKGTTSTLIYEILKKAGKDVYLAGNIGVPYLSLLSKLKGSSYVVLEMSSFQLIDLTKSPDVAVVLNITSDHMDWHKDQKEYVEAKTNIVKYQTSNDLSVINADYSVPSGFARETAAKVIFFSKKSLDKKYKESLLLRGEHNLENIAAAVSVAKALGINDEIILEVLRSFRGLEHRLELVAEIDGRTFYNDSFATGPQPVTAAIDSFSEPLTLILGGYDKGLEYEGLFKSIARKKNIKCIILIGDLERKFGSLLNRYKFKSEVVELGKSSMQAIVKEAFSKTSKGGVILLSPAAASFDMFANYKERGKKFKKAVLSLSSGVK